MPGDHRQPHQPRTAAGAAVRGAQGAGRVMQLPSGGLPPAATRAPAAGPPTGRAGHAGRNNPTTQPGAANRCSQRVAAGRAAPPRPTPRHRPPASSRINWRRPISGPGVGPPHPQPPEARPRAAEKINPGRRQQGARDRQHLDQAARDPPEQVRCAKELPAGEKGRSGQGVAPDACLADRSCGDWPPVRAAEATSGLPVDRSRRLIAQEGRFLTRPVFERGKLITAEPLRVLQPVGARKQKPLI